MESVAQLKAVLLPLLHEAGVSRAALFGSVVRGEMGPESDVDLLVELPPGQSLLDLVRLKRKLEERLQRSVDVLTYASLYHALKPVIERELVPIL